MDNLLLISDNGKKVVGVKDKSIFHMVIPNGITTIGSRAFEGCASLQSVELPNSLTQIDACAFKDCTSLKSIIIPENVIEIDPFERGNPFGGCSSLESIIVDSNNKVFDSRDNCNAIIEKDTIIAGCNNTVIPYGITCIYEKAFSGRVSLQRIDIPDSVTDIENEAFADCRSLQKLFIPNSVTHIYGNAFQNCECLESIIVDSKNNYYDSRDGCNAIIESSSNILMTGCKNTIIPHGVTCIDDYAFAGCTSLQSIAVPDSVSIIGYGAFQNCISLQSIFIPDSITTIGIHRFQIDRTSRERSGWSSSSFVGCINLTSIIVDNNNKHIDSRDGCNAIIETSTNTIIVGCKGTIIPNSVTCIGVHSFKGNTFLKSIDIPNTVKKISECAFGYCTSLQSIDIPNSVTSIGAWAFKGCTSLQSIDIPNSVTSIGFCAFSDCTSLQDIVIPNSVTRIGASFQHCTSLQNIFIPKSVTSIGECAFLDCTSLQNIDIPDNVASIGSKAFQGCTSLSNIDIPNSVTTIGDFAFHKTGLKNVSIPSSVSFIGKHAFCNAPIKEFFVEEDNNIYATIEGVLFCDTAGRKRYRTKQYSLLLSSTKHSILFKYPPQKELTKYVVATETKQLGSCAFKGAENLEEIKLHNDISDFGDEQTFIGCTSLREIHIPPLVGYLPPSCFACCVSLKHVYIPNRETFLIEKDTFRGCASLEDIHFRIEKPENIAVADDSFDEDVFDNCILYIPSGTRWAYRHHPILGKFKNIEIEK